MPIGASAASPGGRPWPPWCWPEFWRLPGCSGAVMYGSYDHIQDDPQVMVILGCRVMPEGHPSILLQDRLDTALDYWVEHQDITIVTPPGARGATNRSPRPGVWPTI